MKISGKVHCFFEQSGTFKRAFSEFGIVAYDYDIQDNFGQTDRVIDLFVEIQKAYRGLTSVFDSISKDDLIIAFFPCIHFVDAKTLFFRCQHIGQKNWSLKQCMYWNIKAAHERHIFYTLLLKLFYVADSKQLRLILENPYNPSGMSYLENNFMTPTLIDSNRMLRGDYFVKPTAYWFVNCSPTFCETYQRDKIQKKIMNTRCVSRKGFCSSERSIISLDYARNFIADFVLGQSVKGRYQQQDLFMKVG